MPDTDDDEGHQSYCSIVAKYVDQNLSDRLLDFAGDCVGEILDGEEQGDEEEETEDGGNPNRHEHPQRRIPGSVVGFL